MSARVVLRVLVALAGIVVTAALTWSVQRLTGERIGLSSTPPTVIRGLAPARPRTSHPRPASNRGSSSAEAPKPTAAVGPKPASGGSAPPSASATAPAAAARRAGDPGDESGDRPGGSGRDD